MSVIKKVTEKINKRKRAKTMVKMIKIMTTEEAFNCYYNDEKLRAEYHKDYQYIDIEKAKENKFNMQLFLDDEALDIERLTEEQCRLLKLDWAEGYYISTFNDEYLIDNE